MSAPVLVRGHAPNIILRLLWFIIVGWWLGGIVSTVAWFLNVTIIGLPLGLWIINRLPAVMTLRPQEQSWYVQDGVVREGVEQQPLLVRALYFVLIGWWFSGLWMAAAYAATATIIGVPLGFWMYNRIGAVTTLYRS
jgi:uncharacterized membrane protein YccF (DUF307 family)